MNENKDVLYLCDQRACGVCRPPCEHTKDIAHAVNFKNKFGAFIEQGATKKTDLMLYAEWLIRDELELGWINLYSVQIVGMFIIWIGVHHITIPPFAMSADVI